MALFNVLSPALSCDRNGKKLILLVGKAMMQTVKTDALQGESRGEKLTGEPLPPETKSQLIVISFPAQNP